jgi:outer membrane lipoprotein-sorting protein
MRKIALLTMVIILAALLAGCAKGKEVDKTPPVISEISASSITETGAVITWTTDEDSTSQVEYGTTSAYGSTTTLNENLVTSHSVTLSELTSGTTYHYRVKSKDASGNEKNSGDYTFITASPGEPTIAFDHESFSFSATEGGANPSNQTLDIWNSGGSTLNWSVSDNADWLTLDPTNGTSTGEHDAVTLSVDISGLAADTYNATITISASGATNTPQTVSVSLTISTAAIVKTIAYSPLSFSFTATEGGANPEDQTLEIWNSGSGTLNWSVSDNADWLTLDPTNGTSTGEHDAVTLSVDISGLAADTYNATITISASGATNTPQTVSVSLTINPALPPELPGTYSYSIEYSDSEGNTMTMDYWVKEGKARADWHWTTSGEEEATIIFISDGNFDWYYLPDENIAYKYLLGHGMNPGTAYVSWFTGYYYGYMSEGSILAAMQAACAAEPGVCASVSSAGQETILGENCTKFTWNETDGSYWSVWISTSSGWLVKWESYNADTGVTDTMQFTNVDLNPTISDAIFDVDQVFAPGYTVEDMTAY